MTLLAELPAKEKGQLFFIKSIDPNAIKWIEKAFKDHGLMIAKMSIAVWFEARKATD